MFLVIKALGPSGSRHFFAKFFIDLIFRESALKMVSVCDYALLVSISEHIFETGDIEATY